MPTGRHKVDILGFTKQLYESRKDSNFYRTSKLVTFPHQIFSFPFLSFFLVSNLLHC